MDILLAHLCRFTVRSPWQLARGFSWKHGISPFMARRPPHHVSGLLARSDGFAYQSPLRVWTRTSDRGRCLAFSVPPSLITSPRRNRNINLLSFAYASRPPLRYRLTLGGLTFPRNPWAFGGGVSHPSLATHARILTRYQSTSPHGGASLRHRRSPTTPCGVRSFGGVLSPVELSAQHRLTSELLRTL